MVSTRALSLGKVGRMVLERAVFQHLGRRRNSMLVGPSQGYDNAVIGIGGGRVLVLTTDPVSIIPSLGMKLSAWLSVHLIASDFTTSSQSPEYAAFDYNFPRDLSADDAEDYLRLIGDECGRLGVTIAAGHTASYPGAGSTVVGGGTMIGFAPEKGYLDPSMSRPGDVVLMTKGAAIEATGVFANSFPRYTEESIGPKMARRARGYVRLCSTVKDALTASSIGIRDEGITSMHDATEGGVLGGLNEMVEASGHAIVVNEELVHVSQEARLTCQAFTIDPLVSLSEGTLLLTCRMDRADDAEKKLRRNGVSVFRIGRVGEGGNGLWSVKRTGKARRILPRRDPYWRAYARAVAENLT
jgi:hydrogenase expression/formation protein HypE